MSIRRDLTFVCDGCGCEHSTGTDDFRVALSEIRHEGWISRREDDEWEHFCCHDCAYAYS
jgi:hypothetical protein